MLRTAAFWIWAFVTACMYVTLRSMAVDRSEWYEIAAHVVTAMLLTQVAITIISKGK